MTSREAIISFTDSDLIDLIPSWADVVPSLLLPIGPSVEEALLRGAELRRQVASGEISPLVIKNQEDAADVIHAICRSLMAECSATPLPILEETIALRALLEEAVWRDDDLEEREALLCSLAFIAWRAARVLNRSVDVHRWEAEYKRIFRQSLAYQVTASSFASDSSSARQIVLGGAETVYQALLYCQDHGEADPQRVADGLVPLYGFLEVESRDQLDLHQFFRGEAAKLVGAALRSVGGSSEAGEWLDRAEKHIRAGVNRRPGLARVLFQRLALCYTSSRFDVVTRICPRLEAECAELGMDEDRVKCRILWAGALKVKGLLQEALDVIEPVRQSKSQLRPVLYGWVLLQSGDIQQLLGNYERALMELAEAALLLREGQHYIALADINWIISCIYRANGRLEEAAALLERSRQVHARLGMKWPEAYHRILIAETYLAMGRAREAEAEIRAALPILEEQGMLADAVIAVNLLREAVRQRKLNPADDRESKPNK